MPASPILADEIVADSDDDSSHFVPRGEAPQTFMRHAMQIAGVQHATDNSSQDVHENLTHWKTFHAQLKQVEGLLVAPYRRQLVWGLVSQGHSTHG